MAVVNFPGQFQRDDWGDEHTNVESICVPWMGGGGQVNSNTAVILNRSTSVDEVPVQPSQLQYPSVATSHPTVSCGVSSALQSATFFGSILPHKDLELVFVQPSLPAHAPSVNCEHR
eukprot:m.316346 g.316346  ORF g.316346 m.316346 type:complete len:117 (-) comp16422_c2_seq9:251-601(-)